MDELNDNVENGCLDNKPLSFAERILKKHGWKSGIKIVNQPRQFTKGAAKGSWDEKFNKRRDLIHLKYQSNMSY